MSNKQEKWVLIDGTGLLYRAYHSPSQKRGTDGHSTSVLHGTLSLVNTYLKALVDKETGEGADHVIVVFDAPGGSYERQALYSDYKKQRPPRPEEIKKQEPWVHDFLKASGIPVVSVLGVESDDTLATLAKTISKVLGHIVALVSADKDMGQSVERGVIWMRPDAKSQTGLKKMSPKVILETFGVRADQIRDFLVLQGDTADNLPGIKKIGPTFAAALLNHFGTVDKMYESLATESGQDELTKAFGSDATAKRLRPFIDDAKEWLPTMTKLVTLRDNVEIDTSEYVNRTPVNDQMMEDMRKEHLLPAWMGYFLKWQQDRAESLNFSTRTEVSRQKKI
jgi:5'-3' exonuclease